MIALRKLHLEKANLVSQNVPQARLGNSRKVQGVNRWARNVGAINSQQISPFDVTQTHIWTFKTKMQHIKSVC